MKTCSVCKNNKPIESFYKRKQSRDGYAYKCAKCTNEYSKKHYDSNTPYYLRKASKHNKKYREKWRDYISTKECVHCGEKESCTFDFHHLDPNKKEYNIGVMVGRKMSMDNIKKEIEKCVILCANCHRKVHAGIIDLHQ